MVDLNNNRTKVCSNCVELAKTIVETKNALKKMQKELSHTVSKLLDIATKGQQKLKEDLEEGGLCLTMRSGTNRPKRKQIVVKIFEEDRIDPMNLHKNPNCIAEYFGKIRYVHISYSKLLFN